MKKLFSLTLTIILTLSLFALTACGGGKADKTSSDKAIGSSASAPQSDTKGESESQPETVVVPNVVGMNVDEATKVLEDLKLSPVIEYLHYVDKSGRRYYDYDNLEEDGLVLKQDIPEGTICAPFSIFKMEVNSNTNPWEYTKNENGTITLNKCVHGHVEDGKITVPTKYEEYIVESVTANAINDLLNRLSPSVRIVIPTGVEILGDVKADNLIQQ